MGAGVSTQARVVNVVTPQKENDDASSTSGDYSTVGYTPQKHQRNALRLSQTVPVQLLAQQGRVVHERVVNVQLYWVRHAFSCANLLEVMGKRWSGLVSIRSKLTPDPELTDLGVSQAERMGQEIYKQGLRPDVVLCSGAMRALETALYAFGPTAPGGGTVYPIPCVSESRAPLVALRNALPFHILHDDDNRLTPTPELQLRLAETHPESRLPVGVNWKYLEECGNDAGPSLSSFYRHLLPVIVSDVIAGRVHSDVFKPLQPFPDKDEVSIVLVSHSMFLRSALSGAVGMSKGKPMNASVWREHVGQLRGGQFHLLGDLLRSHSQRRVECVYGGEKATRADCVDPRVCQRCVNADEIRRVIGVTAPPAAVPVASGTHLARNLAG